MTPPEAPATSAHGDEERRWLREVYQGEIPQLTLRAVVLGGLLGGLLCLSNLYVALKTGLALGVAITACVVAFALHRALVRALPRLGPPLTLLESCAMQSTASAAGYSTGGTIATATAASLLISGTHTPPLVLFAWTLALAGLGVFFALPLKRALINREGLRFPSGTAAAETLRSLYAHGGEGARRARALAVAAVAGGLLAALRDGPSLLPASLALPGTLGGIALAELTFTVDVALLTVGTGALCGLRTSLSMLAGALVCYGLLVPRLHAAGALPTLGFVAILDWSLWPASALLVTSSLAGLAFRPGALATLAGDLARAARGRATDDPLAEIEVPARWFLVGGGALALATVAIARFGFGIPAGYGLLAVALSFLLALVACRATGETDATPTGALGQITQLAYAALMPRDVGANLMTASITGSTAASAADLLTDLKAGHLLGANPRRQLVAQLAGCVVGAAVIVPCFYLLVPDAAALGGTRFPAPGAQMMAGVARVLARGLGSLGPSVRAAMAVGAAIGVVLGALEALLPARRQRLLPSGTGLALGLLLPASMSLSFAAGAIAAAVWEKRRSASARYLVPIAAGLIAGESLVGVLLAVLDALTHR